MEVVVDLEKDFATIYKTVEQVGPKSSGLTHQGLKDSPEMREHQVQILHCTDLGQQFDPNAPAFYESIPVTRLANLLLHLCASCIRPSSLVARHSCTQEYTSVPSLSKSRTSNSAIILQAKVSSHSHNLTLRHRPTQMMNSLLPALMLSLKESLHDV